MTVEEEAIAGDAIGKKVAVIHLETEAGAAATGADLLPDEEAGIEVAPASTLTTRCTWLDSASAPRSQT